MKVTDLRMKAVPELQQELLALSRESFNLRLQKATRQLVQTHQLKKVKHNIARVKMVIREKIGQEL